MIVSPESYGLGMKLPEHIGMHLRHNQHKLYYETVEDYLGRDESLMHEMAPADLAEMIRTGEIWELQWYPDTPVGFCIVYAPTLERALALANADEQGSTTCPGVGRTPVSDVDVLRVLHRALGAAWSIDAIDEEEYHRATAWFERLQTKSKDEAR